MQALRMDKANLGLILLVLAVFACLDYLFLTQEPVLVHQETSFSVLQGTPHQPSLSDNVVLTKKEVKLIGSSTN